MKADVYSYGVLTLEVVSGRTWANANHGGDQKLLAEWVRDPFQNFFGCLLIKYAATIMAENIIYFYFKGTSYLYWNFVISHFLVHSLYLFG